jgi:TRAP-type C4-dicarboxylate transport system substrate-binding protein
MLNVPLADAAGAVVISRKKFDELPQDLKDILVRNGKVYMQKLTIASREDNVKSLETLKKNGVAIIDPASQQALDEYDEIGRKSRRILAGKLYSEDLLNRVEQAVATYRKNNKISK